MKTIGYVRCSTDKQQVSIEAQEAKIRAMAVVKDSPIAEIIVDVESAKSLDRPGMERLLKMVAAKEVDCVVICKLDRLTRSVKDLAELLELFAKKKVSLVSVEESLDTSSASGQLVLNIMCAVSQWERMAIGERTKTALLHIKSQGFPAGSAPYGFKAQPRTAEEKRLKIRKPLVENSTEQAVLFYIAEQRKVGWSFDAIATALNGDNYRTRSGGLWQFQTVQRKYEEARRSAA